MMTIKQLILHCNRHTAARDFLEPALAALAITIIVLLGMTGCSMFGNNAQPPTALEEKFFDVSNAVVPRVLVVTNYSTNVVPVTVVQPVVAYQTNTLGVTVLATNTQLVQSYQTSVVPVLAYETNLVTVPQLVPGSGAAAATGIIGAVAGPFGWGGLAATVLGGLAAGYLKLRNNALAGQATLANQTSGALVNNIETLLNVLQGTPQGQALLPGIKNYLMAHQTDAGVIQNVAQMLTTYLNEPAAQQSADEILKALATLQGSPSPSPSPTPSPSGAKTV